MSPEKDSTGNTGDLALLDVAPDAKEIEKASDQIFYALRSLPIAEREMAQERAIKALDAYDAAWVAYNALPEDIKTQFLQYAVKFQKAYDELKDASVPSPWSDLHRQTLALLKKLELYHRSIALSNDDSLKQTIVLGNLQNVYFEAQPISIEINNRIKLNGLNPPNNNPTFNITNLLGP